MANGLDLVKPLAHHRDGAVSFYLRDPDGNVIQVLYEPAISPINFVAS
jgi:catechol 2,3-dioxygenase-like lactoylglutathione lyase family enzyme